MRLPFTKMQALGNDFVVLDGVRQALALDPPRLRHLADRHLGVGCDQILLLAPAGDDRADFRYDIYNADGSPAEQCGNGLRCVAVFANDAGLSTRERLRFATPAGISATERLADGRVRAAVAVPEFTPSRIPLDAPAEQPLYTLDVDQDRVEVAAVSVGNPHAVLEVVDIAHAPVARLGPALERHRCFPARVNVGFMQPVDAHHLRLRVYERGAGETLGCGTGACAAAVIAIRSGRAVSPVHVELPGGGLDIEWAGAGEPVWMTGPAISVFKGSIDL